MAKRATEIEKAIFELRRDFHPAGEFGRVPLAFAEITALHELGALAGDPACTIGAPKTDCALQLTAGQTPEAWFDECQDRLEDYVMGAMALGALEKDPLCMARDVAPGSFVCELD